MSDFFNKNLKFGQFFSKVFLFVVTILDRVPITDNVDPVDRLIDFMPSKSPYDPRHMIAGYYESTKWISGFFDKDSFTETLAGWGKTVVVGRAR